MHTAVAGAKAENKDSITAFETKAVIPATCSVSRNEDPVARYSAKRHRAGQ